MLEKINNKTAPKEVVNALISLYDKGDLEQILRKYSEESILSNFIQLYKQRQTKSYH